MDDKQCADWIILCRFRLTATTAVRVLKTHPVVRSFLIMDPSTEPIRSNLQWMEKLSNSWFRTWRGSETMARWSSNEDAFTSPLCGLQ